MLLLQNHLNLTDILHSAIRSACRIGGSFLALFILGAGICSAQWRSTAENASAQAEWQATPRTARTTQRAQYPQTLQISQTKSQNDSYYPAASKVSRNPQASRSRQVAYDQKVVRISSDESYVLDPVAENELIAPPEGEPMMIDQGEMSGDPMYGEYCDPAMSHPWQGGEYWFDPRCGFPPFMCRFPMWLGFARGKLWLRGEYLQWWTSGSDTPALVTTSPTGTSPNEAGVLGGDTSVLAGAEKINTDSRSGGRFSLGYWFTEDQCLGMEVNYLGLGKSTDHYYTDTGSTPIIARPYTNAVNGAEDAALIGYPGVLQGSIDVESTSDFDSLEILFRRAVTQRCNYRVDFLLGYRYGRLNDRLVIDDYSKVIGAGGPAPVNTIFDGYDSFETLNKFSGAELGMTLNRRHGRWSYELLLKLALGRTSSRIDINGSTTITNPQGVSTVHEGDILALPSNMGVYESKEFAVMPEVGLNLMYNITPRIAFTAGYNLIFMSHVARPGDQIDMLVNSSQFPPAAFSGVSAPEFRLRTTDFWAHGLNLGFDFRF